MLTKRDFLAMWVHEADLLYFDLDNGYYKGGALDLAAHYRDWIRTAERMLPRFTKAHQEQITDIVDDLWGLEKNAERAAEKEEPLDRRHHAGYLHDFVYLKLNDLATEVWGE